MRKNELNKNDPDNLFKSELENQSFEFDETYWNAAEKMIKAYEQSGKLRYKKRGGWWLWVGVIALLAVVLGLYVFTGSFEKRSTVGSLNGETDKPTVAENTHENVQAGKNVSSDTSLLKITSGTQQAHPETDNLIGMQKEKADDNANVFNTPSNKKELQEQVIFTFNTNKENEKIISRDETFISDKNNFNNTPEHNSATEKNEIPITSISEEKNASVNITSGSDTASLVSATVENHPVIDSALQETDDVNPLNTKKKLHFFAGAHFGYDYVTKNISDPGSQFLSGSQIYISERIANESPLLVTSAGISAGINLHRFHISTGVNTYKFGEKVNYYIPSSYTDSTETFEIITTPGLDTINITYDTSYVLVDTMYVIDSVYTYYITDTIFTTDTIPSVTYSAIDTNISKRDTNLISYFEIPLLFGYRFEKGHWSFTLQTGPSLGIYRFSTGTVLTQTTNNLESITSAQSFTKLSYNWLFTPSIGYTLKPRLEFQIQPWVRLSLKSVIDDAGVKLRYQSYGLHAGFMYHF